MKELERIVTVCNNITSKAATRDIVYVDSGAPSRQKWHDHHHLLWIYFKRKIFIYLLDFFLTQMIDWWMHSFETVYPFGAM